MLNRFAFRWDEASHKVSGISTFTVRSAMIGDQKNWAHCRNIRGNCLYTHSNVELCVFEKRIIGCSLTTECEPYVRRLNRHSAPTSGVQEEGINTCGQAHPLPCARLGAFDPKSSGNGPCSIIRRPGEVEPSASRPLSLYPA